MNRRPVGIGIVGLGDFGLFCLDSYRGELGINVVAAADPRPDLKSRVSGLGPISAYSDWHDLLDSDEVDIVHVATPPNTHAAIGLAAAATGKSVFMEKPLALTLGEADRLILAFEDSGRTLGINYVMRHSPIYKLLIDAVRAGLLGKLRRMSLTNGAQAVPAGHWFWDRTVSGGILIEHGVHFYDVFRQIAGEASAVRTVDGGERILSEVEYESGGWGGFYHDFSLDQRVERLEASMVFDLGTAVVTGWIPERLELKALAMDQGSSWQQLASRFGDAALELADDIASVQLRIQDRQAEYGRAIATGMSGVARRRCRSDLCTGGDPGRRPS